MAFSTKKDALFAKILEDLPFFPFPHLVQADKESLEQSKKAFFEKGITPEFTYSRAYKQDTNTYLKKLTEAKEKIAQFKKAHPILTQLYLAKIEELELRAKIIEAIQQKDDAAVGKLSKKLFRIPDITESLLESAFEKMLSKPHFSKTTNVSITPIVFEQTIRTLLDAYQMKDWTIHRRPVKSVHITHNIKKRRSRIIIPEKRQLNFDKAVKILTHEIEVHALRHENGKRSPYALFMRGTANYQMTEEGLALTLQNYDIPENTYPAGLFEMLGIVYASKYSFAETFKRLFELRKHLMAHRKTKRKNPDLYAKELTWRLMLRIFRGIHHPDQVHAVYWRDAIYWHGSHWIKEHLSDFPQDQHLLYAGKIPLDLLPLLSSLETDYIEEPQFLAKKILKKTLEL